MAPIRVSNWTLALAAGSHLRRVNAMTRNPVVTDRAEVVSGMLAFDVDDHHQRDSTNGRRQHCSHSKHSAPSLKRSRFRWVTTLWQTYWP